MHETNVAAELFEAVRSYLATSAEDIGMSTKIKELGLDSIDLLELLLRLEEKFDIELDVVAFEKCETLGQVAKYIADVK
ncbi:acyl carrier protein [Pseudohoeflea suaedae]|uniref:Acyl carrier protein n=1 Tax=Pseudohoeflea suaedae TaxID=877384 RepID=A0A4R5PK02_9HYPH|nr:acyl carrier protein [Pseudohoeflea suaedae]TDH36020.1 acyl carrier protein [Pseudohoeflea suaedae]